MFALFFSQQQLLQFGNILHHKVGSGFFQFPRQSVAVGNPDAGQPMCLCALYVKPAVANHRSLPCISQQVQLPQRLGDDLLLLHPSAGPSSLPTTTEKYGSI